MDLSAGTQELKVVFDTAGLNLNYINVVEGGGSAPVSASAVAAGPLGGTAWSLPGTVQAEDFDNGTAGVVYNDHTAGNTGGAYRSTDVDIESSGGGHNVGWISAGEWLRYTVNVSAAGEYTLTARVASGGGGTFNVDFNGQDKTGSMRVPNTGGWQSYQEVTANVWLDAGQQHMRLTFLSNGSTGSVGNFDWVRLTAGSTAAPVASAPAPEPAPAPSSGGGRLRVMTWNISFGNAGTWAQAQEIANSGADVVLLQEASKFDEDMERTYPDKLRQLTGQSWSAVWASHFGRYSENEGTLILTRLRIVDRSTRRIYDRGFTRVLVDVGGIHVNVLNAHLDWYDTSMRSAQLEDFMWWGRQFSGPRIAGGDFNAWWGEWWIRRMTEEHTDTWVDVTGSNENGYSLNGAVRFDYLFRAHHDNWRIAPTAMWVTWSGLSDHHPVIADYSVR